MPRWIASLDPKRKMIGLSQKIIIMKSSITGEELYIMVNSSQRPSMRRERQSRNAISMKYLRILMVFLGNEIQKYPSIPTRINAVRIWSGMKCGMSYPFHTHAIKRRSGILFYTSIYFPWTTWNSIYRFFIKSLRQISMLFRNWRGQEYTWGLICKIVFFRRYWHWCRW